MDEIEIRHRASDAKQLQNNNLLIEAFKSVRTGLVEAMEQVPMNDRDTQQAIALSLQCLVRIEKHIQSCIDDEKIYEFKLNSPQLRGI